MKTKMLYTCETCGHEFENEEDCLACEASHTHPVEITDAVYEHFEKPFGHFGFEAPSRIKVKMDNGKVYKYDRSGVGGEEAKTNGECEKL